jgi:deazaflavin-dependent oxidoreductase (nitroreductase family)
MAKAYHVTGLTRFSNRILGGLIRLGVMPARMYMLTVRGRKTGKLYSTPVSLVFADDRRYLVAPYGEGSWVKNARANGEVVLTRGSKQEAHKIRPLPPQEAAVILKAYIQSESITRPYFTATIDSPFEAFEVEASEHPVFELLATD